MHLIPVCRTWTEIHPKGGAKSVERTGHNIFLRGNSLYVVGGFDGNFYGGMDPIPITTQLFLQDYSCAASYCASLISCNACTSVPMCAWCSSLGACVTSTAIDGNYGVSTPPCNGSSTCDPPVNNCFYLRTCGDCLAGDSCSWCEDTSSCFPQEMSEQTTCNSQWNNGTCGNQLCGLMSSCHDCLTRSTSELKCNWCPYTNTCISSAGTCPRPPIDSVATCSVPCSQYHTASKSLLFFSSLSLSLFSFFFVFHRNLHLHVIAGSCYQSHTCMWCASQKLCFSNDVYLVTFTFGECQTWSQCELKSPRPQN